MIIHLRLLKITYIIIIDKTCLNAIKRIKLKFAVDLDRSILQKCFLNFKIFQNPENYNLDVCKSQKIKCCTFNKDNKNVSFLREYTKKAVKQLILCAQEACMYINQNDIKQIFVYKPLKIMSVNGSVKPQVTNKQKITFGFIIFLKCMTLRTYL